MFGTEAAFNLNSSLYDWANDAPGVYIFFNTDENAGAAGSNFTAGNLALTGAAGVIIGAALTAILVSLKKKKSRTETA